MSTLIGLDGEMVPFWEDSLMKSLTRVRDINIRPGSGRNHNVLNSTNRMTLSCSKCFAVFASRTALDSHVRADHQQAKVIVVDGVSHTFERNSAGYFLCPCGREVADPRHLVTHRNLLRQAVVVNDATEQGTYCGYLV